MDKCKIFTKNLDELIKLRELTLTEFAKEIGISRTTLRSILTRKNMSFNTAVQVAEGLGMSLDELATDPNIPKKFKFTKCIMQSFDCYASLPEDKQKDMQEHMNHFMEILKCIKK